MEPERQDYRGHRIELRVRDDAEPSTQEGAEPPGVDDQAELLVDDEAVPFGRLPDGSYFLHEFAYEWNDDLVDLARRLIDYRDRTDEVRHEAEGR